MYTLIISVQRFCLFLNCGEFLLKVFCFGVFPYSRTSVEKIRRADIMPFASQGLQTRDIDACVILDFKANTAKVNMYMLSNYLVQSVL